MVWRTSIIGRYSSLHFFLTCRGGFLLLAVIYLISILCFCTLLSRDFLSLQHFSLVFFYVTQILFACHIFLLQLVCVFLVLAFLPLYLEHLQNNRTAKVNFHFLSQILIYLRFNWASLIHAFDLKKKIL